MRGFTSLSAQAVSLLQDNIDTDQLLPKQFLNAIDRIGFGQHLFHDWRYLDDKEAVLNPDFVLNKPEHQGAEILLSGANFGCGSSREHAPWALADYGFKVIIAESFADIFYANCVNNQMLLITLPAEQIKKLSDIIATKPDSLFHIDLERELLTVAAIGIGFSIEPLVKQNLLLGLDRIGLTLTVQDAISAYEKRIPRFMRGE
ncbi:3-isopropylmalate dehydratase small subunit [Rheinheimera sp. UJ63]|uniref:3-isopropylmalate dehydratase small subunit n=1 Tax=Rheinheimera sp. UJ63 TaxID=2910157 RepID=UPI001F34F875|nr:3-isopropylmalate dehydratase small subunit [Rheinheimera sp. UJ63]MCF4008972.1 3-isopropylmalate dehydratase small subunit [Rheinheimera sp. UJ63]